MRLSTEATTGMGNVVEALRQAEADDQAIEDRHVVPGAPKPQSGGIFPLGNIALAVQAILNVPILTAEREQLG
jgi:hypothetical protein